MLFSKRSLVALSVGFNIAFILFWGVQWFDGKHSSSGAPISEAQPLAGRYADIQISKEQWKEMQLYLQAFVDRTNEIRKNTRQLRGHMLKLLAEPVAGEMSIRNIQREIHENQALMKDEVLGLLLKEKSVLEPEQFEELLKAMQKYGGPAFGRFGPGPCGNDAAAKRE